MEPLLQHRVVVTAHANAVSKPLRISLITLAVGIACLGALVIEAQTKTVRRANGCRSLADGLLEGRFDGSRLQC